MKREFLINIIILLLINFLVKPIYIFAIEAGIQNLTGPDEYGIYFVLYDFVFLFLFINDAGIQNYNSKFIASNRKTLGPYFGQLLGYKLFTGAIFAVITFLSAGFFGYFGEHWMILSFLVGVFFLNSVFILLRSTLSALGYYRWDSWISALDKMILILVLGYLVWQGYQGQTFEIIWLPLAQLIVAIIVCSIAVLLLKKSNLEIKVSYSLPVFKQMLKATFPYALILLFAGAYSRADAVMLDQMLPDGSYQAGLYAAAYRFIEAGNMVGYIFAALLLPMFANMISEKEEVQPLFSFAFRLLFILGFGISLVCIFYSKDIYSLLYSQEYTESHELLQLLMWSFIPVTLSNCFGSFLIADGKLKAINLIFLTGLVINIIGNYILIPSLKAEGTAYTTFGTQLFLLIGMIIYLHVKRRELQITRLVFHSLAILMIGFFIFIAYSELSLHWVLKAFLSGFSLLIMVFLTKWLRVSDFKLLYRK